MISRNRSGRRTTEATGRRLLEVVVYGKCCRIGGTLSLDHLAETSEVGDWKMPDFKTACGIRGEPGLADRRGRYADADHGGVGGDLNLQGQTAHGFQERIVKPAKADSEPAVPRIVIVMVAGRSKAGVIVKASI